MPAVQLPYVLPDAHSLRQPPGPTRELPGLRRAAPHTSPPSARLPWCAVVHASSFIEPVFTRDDPTAAPGEGEGWLEERFFLNHHVRG